VIKSYRFYVITYQFATNVNTFWLSASVVVFNRALLRVGVVSVPSQINYLDLVQGGTPGLVRHPCPNQVSTPPREMLRSHLVPSYRGKSGFG
jgi:hypothetical protein